MAVISDWKEIQARIAAGGWVACAGCGDKTIGVNYCEACGFAPLCGYCWRTEHSDHGADAPHEKEEDGDGMNLNQRSWYKKRGGR